MQPPSAFLSAVPPVWSFQWGGARLSVAGVDGAIIDRVGALLDLAPEEARAEAAADVRVSTGPAGRMVESLAPPRPCAGDHDLVANLALVVAAGLLDRHGSAVLHAASFAADGRACLLVGPGRCGKTTLAVTAWLRGLDCVGDDSVAITPGPTVWASPKPVAYRLSETALDLASFPRGVGVPATVLGERRLVLGRRVPGMARVGDSFPVEGVFLVGRAAGSHSFLEHVPAQDAARVLLEESRSLGLETIRVIKPQWEAGRVWRLRVGEGDPEGAVSLATEKLLLRA